MFSGRDPVFRRVLVHVWWLILLFCLSGCAELKVLTRTENAARIRVYRSDNWRGRTADFAVDLCGGTDRYKVIKYERVRGAGGRGGGRTTARELTVVCQPIWDAIRDEDGEFDLFGDEADPEG